MTNVIAIGFQWEKFEKLFSYAEINRKNMWPCVMINAMLYIFCILHPTSNEKKSAKLQNGYMFSINYQHQKNQHMLLGSIMENISHMPGDGYLNSRNIAFHSMLTENESKNNINHN